MIYGDFDLVGIADIPHISTMFSIDSSKWQEWKVQLTDSFIDIAASSSKMNIDFKSIQYVDRSLSQAIISRIQSTSRSGSFFIIDYKKKATVGKGDSLFSAVFAGHKSEVARFKNFVTSLLGLEKDSLVGNIKAEEIRLLFLLSTNVKKVEILVPIFDGNKDLLQKTFVALKSKELVDDYAGITEKGRDVLDKVKGIERREMGVNVDEKFSELSKYWNYLDSQSSSPSTNSVVWKTKNSSVFGHVVTEDLWEYLPVKDISEIQFEKFHGFGFGLMIQTNSNSNIYVRTADISVIVALHSVLNKKEDIRIRLMFYFYIGCSDAKSVFSDLNLSEYDYETIFNYLLDNDFVNRDDMELSNKGLGIVKSKIQDGIAHSFAGDQKNIDLKAFKRYEEIRARNAKKKVLSALQSKHS
jgi:hypothetical protein